ncbi:MAG TPA: hypothetical protein VG034_11210 [Acidimicrobiia bacterium]|nr:hypothetical protein [Acidimicrobiia bacterium]
MFTSARPDPDAKKGDERDDRAALWLLPAGGGEARLLADPPAGVDGLAVARDQGTRVVSHTPVASAPGTVVCTAPPPERPTTTAVRPRPCPHGTLTATTLTSTRPAIFSGPGWPSGSNLSKWKR